MGGGTSRLPRLCLGRSGGGQGCGCFNHHEKRGLRGREELHQATEAVVGMWAWASGGWLSRPTGRAGASGEKKNAPPGRASSCGDDTVVSAQVVVNTQVVASPPSQNKLGPRKWEKHSLRPSAALVASTTPVLSSTHWISSTRSLLTY